jgi:hypothetical protein
MDVEIITDVQPINIKEKIVNNTILIEISNETNTSCMNTEQFQNNNITTKDAETGFRPLNLYTERLLTNQILIEPNTSTVDANLILENTDFLPLMESVSNVSINNDPEYIDPITETNGGRKRIIQNRRKEKQLQRNIIPRELELKCNHTEMIKKNVCRVSELSEEDLTDFKQNLCKLTTKIEQDKFLITMITVSDVKRTDRKKTNRSHRMVVKYFIPQIRGNLIPVCLDAFSSVTSITRRRLNIISKTFKQNHSSPTEKRGGIRVDLIQDEITDSIKEHIKAFKCRKSHHTRKDTGRSYLPPTYSIKYMWENWYEKRKLEKKQTASLSKYQKIFTTKFNISFGHPRQDTCSYCMEQKIKIQTEGDIDKKSELMLELTLHKRKAKRFFELLKTETLGEISCSFDMMQTQPLPKLSVTDVFYSRQVWLYNLTFVISDSNQKPENCILYSWNETESGRGPNEVCSALIHFLESLEYRMKTSESPPTILNLFSDSCSGQNKNQFTMITLLYYINYKTIVFTQINHIFPVRGHSYMPPDRVFGRIEQILRKKETILSPNQYFEIFKNFCTVNAYGKDFKIYDIKSAVKTVVKTKIDFKSTEQKVYSYIKGKNSSIRVSKTYAGAYEEFEVIKRHSDISKLFDNIKILPKTNCVKLPKQNDVKKLLKFFTIPEDAQEFYEDIFNNNNDPSDEDIHYYEEDNE